MNAALIPLFPLNMVLFPGQAIPLHIFEQRYREMTRHCINTQSPFGIALAHEGKVSQTGCSAMIVKKLKEHEDGRIDILTVGQSAFRIIATRDQKSYLEADVEILEENFEGIDAELSAELEVLFDKCHQILYDGETPTFEIEGGISLAFHVASELPMEVPFRQILLEERSESERQRILISRLQQWYPQLERREHVRQKAAGNGHGKL